MDAGHFSHTNLLRFASKSQNPIKLGPDSSHLNSGTWVKNESEAQRRAVLLHAGCQIPAKTWVQTGRGTDRWLFLHGYPDSLFLSVGVSCIYVMSNIYLEESYWSPRHSRTSRCKSLVLLPWVSATGPAPWQRQRPSTPRQLLSSKSQFCFSLLLLGFLYISMLSVMSRAPEWMEEHS